MDTQSCTPCCNPPLPINVPGPAGNNAYTTVANIFTIPTALSNVTVTVATTAGMVVGQNIFVGGANFMVSSIDSPVQVTLEYLGFSGDTAAGQTVAAGSIIVPGVGNLTNAVTSGYTTTVGSTTIPAVGSTTAMNVVTSAPFAVGQNLFVKASATTGCNFIITAKNANGTTVTVEFLGFSGDATGTIATGSLVCAGLGNYSSYQPAITLSAGSLVIPAVGSTGTVSVVSTVGFSVGQNVWFGLANFTITAISGANITLKTLGFQGDTAAGGTINAGVVMSAGTGNATAFGSMIASYIADDLTNSYTITGTVAQIQINAVDVALTIPSTGTWMLEAYARLDYAGTTSAAHATGVTNIACDLYKNGSLIVSAGVPLYSICRVRSSQTTQWGTTDRFTIPRYPVLCSAADVISLRAGGDANYGTYITAGSMIIPEARIVAVKFY